MTRNKQEIDQINQDPKSKIKITCELCGKPFSKYSISEHFRKEHGMTDDNKLEFLKNYYDTYIEPDVEHVCEICRKPVPFVSGCHAKITNLKYNRVCSSSCRSFLSNKLFHEKWQKEHPGEPLPVPFNDPKVQQKIKETLKAKYGENISNPGQIPSVKEKVKKTFIERYGNYYWASEEGKKKIKESYKKKYGVEWYTQTEEHHKKAKETWKERYGVDEPFRSDEIKEKIYQTRLANHSFFTSKIEDQFYVLLCSIYGEEDVIRRYRDPRYSKPSGYMFECDLYVKSWDCFIEIQGYKSHGGHPSNGTETPDSLGLTEKEFKTFESDIIKRSKARDNCLRYREVFIGKNIYHGKKWKDQVRELVEGDREIWTTEDKLEYYPKDTKFI